MTPPPPRVQEVVVGDGVRLPGRLVLPAEPHAGLACLHPASGGSRDDRLAAHLARIAPTLGIAVLTYDRRPQEGGDDVPLAAQAADALSALEVLRDAVPGGVATGLWGFSQGAWAAPIAAVASPGVSFLVLVGACGVSPAAQMRHFVTESFRRAGRHEDELAEALAARSLAERVLRGEADAADAQAALDRISVEPWFELAWLPATITAGDRWADMDLDPAPAIRAVTCPTLLVYGQDEECVPVEPSVAVWRESAAARAGRLEVALLAGVGHDPMGPEGVAAGYETVLVDWLTRLPAPEASAAAR